MNRLTRCLLAILMLAAITPAAPPAAAEQVTAREGVTGHAGLADIQDSPGAICTFAVPGPGSIGETIIRINPPVVFAADTTPGVDQQQVGWRARIHAWSPREDRWIVAAESPLATAEATDQTATYFGGDGWIRQFLLTSGVYNVSIEMLWFDPEDPDAVSGRITAVIERYGLLVVDRAGTRQAGVHSTCRAPDHRGQDRSSSPPRPA